MKTFFSALVALSLLALSPGASADEAGPHFETDLDSAQKIATESDKPVIVVFSAVWCPPCQQMKKSVYPSDTVKPYHEKFIWTYLDADKPENQPLMAKFGVSGIPHIAFLEPNGDPIGKFVGAAPPEGFTNILDQVLEMTDQEESEKSTAKAES